MVIKYSVYVNENILKNVSMNIRTYVTMFTRSMRRVMEGERIKDILTTPGIITRIVYNLPDLADTKTIYMLSNDARYRHEIEPFLKCRVLIKKMNALMIHPKGAYSCIERTMRMLEMFDYIYDNVDFFHHFGRRGRKRFLKVVINTAIRIRREVKYDDVNFDNEFRVYFKNKMRRLIARVSSFL